MADDLVIRNGTVIDATDAAARLGDVAVDGERITAIGKVVEQGRRELDAAGNWVTPDTTRMQSDRRPLLHRRVIEFAEAENERDAHLRPQTTSRGVGVLFALDHITPWHSAPAWAALAKRPFPDRLAALEDESVRAALVADAETHSATLDLDPIYVLLDGKVQYGHYAANSLKAHAESEDMTPAAAFIALNCRHQGRMVLYFPGLNRNMEAVGEMLRNPTVAEGLADSSVHVGQIRDTRSPNWLLAYWVRERGLLSVEETVRGWTNDAADLLGVRDRGRLRPSALADINVIDLGGIARKLPEYRHDFPEGAWRYVQAASGYGLTVVNGRIFMEGGEPTGVYAGKISRA